MKKRKIRCRRKRTGKFLWLCAGSTAKTGMNEKNRTHLLFAMISMIMMILTGCGDETPEVSDIEITQTDSEAATFMRKRQMQIHWEAWISCGAW